ncbi:Glycosyl hydrolase family 32 domain protein [Hallella multisaccharivorax DSM 17128]|uniref:beta-fructofuranosidase n=2 Tax=Hallella multisaccharivorax TaxID=310514 RepID=F8N5Q3_9BACT|nr:Glycosyl hydrolase family 32 domain protein [Hallella multisaccharivorax DSM 17128]
MIFSSIAVTLAALSLTACSDDNFSPDADKDWAGTTSFFNSTDEKGFDTYYQPAVGRCGDPMPFYDEKTDDFKVLYLQEYDNNGTYNYHPIWGVSTKDGANYESMGEVLPTATSDKEQDAALGTGCAVYDEQSGTYYIYYTGHNPKCESTEVVMRATSPDMKTWTKDNAWSLKGMDYGYSKTDFRDPQVFKTEDGTWHMVIASTLKFAEFTSTDLKTWQHTGSFNMVWDRQLECPDIFKMGNYWYFVYSEGYRSDWSRKVKYFVASSFEDLKKCFNDPGANWPKDGHEGVLDSRAFYAGKTASNGTDRYIWGWCPYRTGSTIFEKNINVGADGEPNWSGALVCHKLIQHSDGTLTLGEVPAISAKYDKPQDLKAMEQSEGATVNGSTVSLSGNSHVLFNRLGNHNKISFTVKTAGNTDKFGFSLVRAGGDEDGKHYSIVINPENDQTRKINFEEQGKDGIGFVRGIDGYNFARPADNTYHVTVYTDNSVCVVYINDVACYTNRIYGIQKNCWSLDCYDGQVTVSEVKVMQYKSI